MLIYIVRHGETNANLEGRMQGWTDDLLNDNGRKLAVITGRELRGVRFDCCISSPLIRAIETAQIILGESDNHIQISLDDRLKEINMGSWEKKKIRPGEREIDEHELSVFFRTPFQFSGCPQGENIFQVCGRTQLFLKELTAKNDDRTYLISTHGYALRAMLNYLYDDPSDFWHGHVPYNCAVNIIEAKDGVVKLIADDFIYYDLAEIVDRFAVY